LSLLGDILKAMSEGKPISIVPLATEVTTQSAAEMLGCSRPYLVKLLEEGKIAFTKVGKHRRIKFEDVIKYKNQMKEAQKKHLIELMNSSVRFTAVLDTNVIYPVIIRDLLFWFAHYDMYTPKWSNHIFDEWKEVMERKGVSPEESNKRIQKANDAFPDDVEKYAASSAQAQYIRHIIDHAFAEGGTKITFEK